jgi:hypothetical protein
VRADGGTKIFLAAGRRAMIWNRDPAQSKDVDDSVGNLLCWRPQTCITDQSVAAVNLGSRQLQGGVGSRDVTQAVEMSSRRFAGQSTYGPESGVTSLMRGLPKLTRRRGNGVVIRVTTFASVPV